MYKLYFCILTHYLTLLNSVHEKDLSILSFLQQYFNKQF